MSTITRLLALASEKIDPNAIGLTNPPKNADAIVGNVLNTVYAWAGIICVLIIVIAGYLYATSAADAAQTKRAKNAILYSIVGLIVIMMAFVITQFVLGRF